MNTTNSIFDLELYHQLNKTLSKQKYSYRMETYQPLNDSDELNPKYLFQAIATELLVVIVKKQIDLVELARKELKNRGLNNEGKWGGFKNV